MCHYELEKNLLRQNYKQICGIDEVGRGALSGPVVAGAVILEPRTIDRRIDDSKKLSAAKRMQLAETIYNQARAYSVGWCWNDEIDEMNILQATRQAMKMAVRGLQIRPDYALIDGMGPDFLCMEGQGVIKGDAISYSIAAASIIAKVFRDKLMEKLSAVFPHYGMDKNKGYPTLLHKQAISRFGHSPIHRLTFRY